MFLHLECVHVCSGTFHTPAGAGLASVTQPVSDAAARGFLGPLAVPRTRNMHDLQIIRTHRGTAGHTISLILLAAAPPGPLGLGKGRQVGSCEVNYFVTCFYDIMILI